MMSYLSDTFLINIKDEFPNLSIHYREIELGGIIPAFFISVENQEILKEQWKSITKFIAINYQSLLKDEFCIWNVYVFFIVPEQISEDLKYLIQNDTFSSRKIVVYPQQDIDIILEEYVLNKGLNMVERVSSEEMLFEPNKIMEEILKEVTPKKRITEEIKTALNYFIEKS